ncbi:hypothetical protein SAY86_012620 [Trapa natans]|uniref:LIM zinc-binding domain-containing protein n=1 Tax=Trapa natans TaxID=22666 RepID=A0AAN7RBR1_TRANT|nr:hypothetical protein SAY86_012620 [Trapa natans]
MGGVMGVLSDSDNEDINRAIALSLLEQSRSGGIITDDPQLEEDELLARALQESLDLESRQPRTSGCEDALSPQGYRNGHSPREFECGIIYQPVTLNYPFPAGYRKCAGCKDIIVDHREIVSVVNAVWHPECFRCHGCNHAFPDYEFSMHNNYPYHKHCYKELFPPKCDICNDFIPANLRGQIQIMIHPFWLQKYCSSHEHDGTPRCCSCERMEPRYTKYVTLGDGRELCLECLDSAIMDTDECQPLYRDIQQFYENLDMKIDQSIPLLLVERHALNEARQGEKNSHHHMPETRGLCLSEEHIISTVCIHFSHSYTLKYLLRKIHLLYQTWIYVCQVSRGPRIGREETADMVTEPCRLVCQYEVTGILVLYGLPRLLTGTIVAHEMMHAWLRLRGYPSLRPDVEEGICQVLAHLWLESELNRSRLIASSKGGKAQRSQFDQKLGDFFKHQPELDTSPVYGEGFRAGWQAVRKHGLNRTLDHISVTGNFPH